MAFLYSLDHSFDLIVQEHDYKDSNDHHWCSVSMILDLSIKRVIDLFVHDQADKKRENSIEFFFFFIFFWFMLVIVVQQE